jgi:hypothetical protein
MQLYEVCGHPWRNYWLNLNPSDPFNWTPLIETPDRTRSVQDREAAPWGEVISSANNRVTMTGYWKLSSMQKKIPALKRVRGLPYFNA